MLHLILYSFYGYSVYNLQYVKGIAGNFKIWITQFPPLIKSNQRHSPLDIIEWFDLRPRQDSNWIFPHHRSNPEQGGHLGRGGRTNLNPQMVI